MASAGSASSNKIADALRALPSESAPETLELIDKLTQNIVRNPSDEKFRRIKLSNPKIAAAITNVPNAVDALKQMGWVETPDGLALPQSVCFVHEREVLAIIEAKEHYKKASTTAAVACADGDEFEFKDMDYKHVRLVKHINDSPPLIEVLVEGVQYWRGIPTFSQSTSLMACGDKKPCAVPEASRSALQKYLAAMPSASSIASTGCAAEDIFEYKSMDSKHVRLVKHLKVSPPHIEVLFDGEPHWKGIPTFSQSTSLMACGDKKPSPVPEANRAALQKYLAAMPTSNSITNVACGDEDAFEYNDMACKRVRLVKHLSDSAPHIEMFVEGVSFWKGIPTFSQSTSLLACGDKGVSAVPEAFRAPLGKYLAAMPPPSAYSTANADCGDENVFEYQDRDREQVRLVKHLNDSPPCIEVFVQGVSFWKGIPTFSQSTTLLACGDKGASGVPEAYHERLRQFLATMPAQPVLKLNLG